jgi:hypothetical protein
VGRFFTYEEVVRGTPTPAPDIVRVTAQIAALPPLQSGLAVVAGSSAWGSVSVRSDIDVMAYRTVASADLERQIDAVLETYRSDRPRHEPPKVDVTWIGAETETLIARDNLVSSSAPVLEQHVVSEIFERTCVRLVDHIQALAGLKGNPWRDFADRYLSKVNAGSAVRRDVLREYVNGIAVKWRQQPWSDGSATALTREQLDALGHAEGFADHVTRLVLADLGVYPRPDRHEDIHKALIAIGEPWGDDLRRVLAPLFALGGACSRLVDGLLRDTAYATEQAYYSSLREAAATVDMNAIEEFTWRYVGS